MYLLVWKQLEVHLDQTRLRTRAFISCIRTATSQAHHLIMRKLLPVDVGQDTTHFLPHPGPQYTTELLQTILLARIRLAQENSLVS